MGHVLDSIELRSDLARVIITSVPDRPGIAGRVFTKLGEAGFNVEVIAQTGAALGRCDLALAVGESEARRLVDFLQEHQDELESRGILLESGLALLSVYGTRLATTPGVAGRVFTILGDQGINIEVINAGPVSLSLMVPKDKAEGAYAALRAEFNL